MIDREAFKKHLPGVVGAAVLVLAVIETAAALLAPWRTPTETHWKAASAAIRSQFRAGDLIVAAPSWSDPVMRFHLGDLMNLEMVARLDAAVYGRVWELSQRGARAPEAQGNLALDQSYGPLHLRRWDRPAAQPLYNFVKQWREARVLRQSESASVECPLQADRHQCPNIGFNWVKPAVMEMDFGLRQALYAQPVGAAEVVLEYKDVPLGNTLAVAGGLHHTWLRKGGQGTVSLAIHVGGTRVGQLVIGNRSRWKPLYIDTRAFAGQRQIVRFSITSNEPFSRHFGFAAEARQ